jgi:glycosyltransferase involved in cell wall biosynthesis
VGPAFRAGLKRLTEELNRLDPSSEFVQYRGAVPYETLHNFYKEADLKVFASSCENMPNILLEAMSAGLPIACSRHGPMPEVLGDAGVYFDPEDSHEIAEAIETLIRSPQLRARNAGIGFERAQQYSWKRCASETFAFLAECARRNHAPIGGAAVKDTV